jgi:ankyrin repeat protein
MTPRRVGVVLAGAGLLAALLFARASASRNFEAILDSGEEVGLRTLEQYPLEVKGAVEVKGARGRTLLGMAAERGRAEIVRRLIARGAQLDARDDDRLTPLHLAARGGHTECVQALLAAGADPNAGGGPIDDKALHEAARGGFADVVRTILGAPGTNPNARNVWGETALHIAAEQDWRAHFIAEQEWRGVAELLAAASDRDARDARGYTALHVAATSDNVVLISLYHRLGYDLDPLAGTGATPLDAAITAHQDLAADRLLTFGAHAKLHATAIPPLHDAARMDDVPRAARLLARGADPTGRYDGKTPADFARENRSDGVLDLLALVGRPSQR